MPTSVGQAVPGGCRLLQDMAVSPLKRFSTAAPDVPRQGDRVWIRNKNSWTDDVASFDYENTKAVGEPMFF
jgi:hypothetical protein